jgi:hypothetical protein
MISSNSSIDFISVLRASGADPTIYIQTPEFREWLDDYLSENTLTVQFTKSIPSDKQPKGTIEKTTTDAVRVFDVEIQDWRSFNISNIKRLEY